MTLNHLIAKLWPLSFGEYSNILNHFSECKQMINTQFVLEYLEPFNCAQTIAILVCKQICSDSFKNKITYKLTNHTYNHLTVCKQMSSGSFKDVIYKLCIYKSYV